MLYDPKWEAPAETKPLEPWRELLLQAANLMETRGHCQRSLRDEAGRVCFIGALAEVMGDAWTDGNRINPAAERAIAVMNYYTGGSAVSFNDHHSGNEVVAAMRACANAG